MRIKTENKDNNNNFIKELCKWLVAAAVFTVPAVILEAWIFFGV